MKVKDFKDKVAIITGSSIGIGKAIAQELGNQGMKLVINGRDFEKLNQTTKELQDQGIDVLSIAADIRYAPQCERLIDLAFQRFGRIDIVINNAAVSSRGSVEEAATDNIEILIDTNYVGCAYISKYAIPHLRKSKGHLIFINSVGGFNGMPYNMAYTASKKAQAALAQAVRIELLDDHVHVGIVYVGFTENDPRKTILDVDGEWIYLPKRNNIRLMTREMVARSVFRMIQNRKSKITLTSLGHFTNIVSQYFPRLTALLIRWNRKKIRNNFTFTDERRILNRIYKAKEIKDPIIISDG